MRERLMDALSRLLAGELSAVILQGGAFYVQFAAEGGGLLFEAVGEANLDRRLTPDQLRRLHDAGFAPPARAGSGNLAMSMPADPEAAAELAISVMAGVYAVTESDLELVEV
jgi:hypothetical protein